MTDPSLPIAMLDSLSFAVTSVDLEGTILFLNQTAADNLSTPREELLGRSVFEFFPQLAAATRERIMQTANKKAVQQFESVVDLPDGRKKHFSSAYYPTFGANGDVVAVQIVAFDVRGSTDPETSSTGSAVWAVVADDLSMTAERLAAILESLPIVVGIHDVDSTIRYVNWVVEGLDINEVIGTRAARWLPEESRNATEAAYARVLESREQTEYKVEGLSGRKWLTRLVPLMHANEVQQILSSTVEITELSRLEARLRHQQKIQSLGTMAGGIAHDFNNLLTAIMGNLGLLQRSLQDDCKASSYLESIATATRKAAELCSQMLAYAGRDRPRREPASLNQIVEEMSSLTRAAVSAKIEEKYELAADLPMIRCSSSQVGQVVLNLINNAADAIGDGHGTITISTDEVLLTEEVDEFLPKVAGPGRFVRLSVRDTGKGMDAQVLPLIFDPFFSTKSTGHGLGLSAVLGIVAGHEASIKVESTEGKGTSVTVLFPMHESLGSTHTPDASDPAWEHGLGNILVVDDEKVVREMVANVLGQAGYCVHEAANGEEALTMLRAATLTFNAVILDVNMPVRDGISTLAALRKFNVAMPVLISSGMPAAPTADQRRDGYLHKLDKPYTADDLVKAVADATRSSR